MLKHIFSVALILCFTVQLLFSEDTSESDPLFTGSLLSVYARNTDPGKFTFQPYIYASRVYGFYDSHGHVHHDRNIHQYIFSSLLETGITKFLDIGAIPSLIYARSNHFDTFSSGDLPIFLGMQFALDQKNSWVPDIRLLMQETFPIGNYQNLNPALNGIDATGTGAYETSFIFVTRKIFGQQTRHPSNINLNLTYAFATNVEVDGLNIYGGTIPIAGKARPGDELIANFAFEMDITKHFGYCFDLNYHHKNVSFFTPKNSTTLEIPSYDLLSFAPCLEYSFDENTGFIWGVWFSLMGRNTPAFFTAAVSFFHDF